MQERLIARKGRARIAVVGAGAGGVELVLSVAHRLRRDLAAAGFDPGGISFLLVTDADDILPTFPPAFRTPFRHILAARGIAVVADAAVRKSSLAVCFWPTVRRWKPTRFYGRRKRGPLRGLRYGTCA